jgi:hypothetical protein
MARLPLTCTSPYCSLPAHLSISCHPQLPQPQGRRFQRQIQPRGDPIRHYSDRLDPLIPRSRGGTQEGGPAPSPSQKLNTLVDVIFQHARGDNGHIADAMRPIGAGGSPKGQLVAGCIDAEFAEPLQHTQAKQHRTVVLIRRAIRRQHAIQSVPIEADLVDADHPVGMFRTIGKGAFDITDQGRLAIVEQPVGKPMKCSCWSSRYQASDGRLRCRW